MQARLVASKDAGAEANLLTLFVYGKSSSSVRALLYQNLQVPLLQVLT